MIREGLSLSEKVTPWHVGAVIVATLVGFWLRVSGLGDAPLASLEIYTWDFSHQTLPFIFDRLAHIETNPPLYYLLIKLIMGFGDSEFILRLPSAIAGTVAIPLVYVLGRAGGAPFSGALGAAILALSTPNITYSRLARCYTLVEVSCLLAAIATVIIINAYFQPGDREPNNNRRETLGWGLFIFAGVCGFYLHYVFLVEILVLQCAFVIAWLRKGRWDRRLIFSWLLSSMILALCMSWGLELAQSQAYSDDINWMQVPTLPEAADLLFQIYGYTQLFRFQPWASLLFIFCALLGLAAGWRQSAAVLVSGTLFVLFPIMLFVISQIRPVFIDRVLIPPSFSVYFLAAYGCAVLLQTGAELANRFVLPAYMQGVVWGRLWKLAGILALLAPAAISARNGWRGVPNTEPYDEATKFLGSTIRPGDAAAGTDGVIYYERKIGGEFPYYKLVNGNSAEAQITYGTRTVHPDKVRRLAPADHFIYLVLRDRLKSSEEIRAKIGHEAPAIASFGQLGIYRLAGTCPASTSCLDDVEGMNTPPPMEDDPQ